MNHKERAHALLSASGAHRWLECTPSARLEDTFPDVDTVYSKEGTRAHEIAEVYLAKELKGETTEIDLSKDDARILHELKPYLDYVINHVDDLKKNTSL